MNSPQKKSNESFSEDIDSQNEKEDLMKPIYLEYKRSFQNLNQFFDDNIFVQMKLRVKNISINQRKSLLPEKKESGLLNKREMKEIDKGLQLIKNTHLIKENIIVIKMCDLLKYLCLFYIKNSSLTETLNLKSFNHKIT